MFFALSKVIGFVVHPSNLLILIGLAGVALSATRFARLGRRMMATAFVLIAIFGLTPLPKLMMLPLEKRFPAWQVGGQDGGQDGAAPVGVVVLGGALDGSFLGARVHSGLNEAAERMTAAVALARQYPAARLIFSGGSAALLATTGTEAAAARTFFGQQGIDPLRLAFDDRARNTAENAVYSKVLADPKPGERWLLVTSASHMPRAIGTFRRAGFPVEAFSVDWRTRGAGDLAWPFRSFVDGLRLADTAAHEWMGLLAYRLAGHTAELFPENR